MKTKRKNSNNKVFVIYNFHFFGDILVTNSLCQEIKRIFPDSKVVYVVRKSMYDVAKYQKDVDDVIFFDWENIFSVIKFLLTFPYKNAYASFSCLEKYKTLWYAKLQKSKYIITYLSCNRNPKYGNFLKKLLNSKYSLEFNFNTMQELNISYLSGLTKEELKNPAIEYIPPQIESDLIGNIQNLAKDFELISLCTTSSKKEKDLPVNVSAEIINKIIKTGRKVILTGSGKSAAEYVQELYNKNCTEFIDLTNKTSIVELAHVLKLSKALISVDTGTLHLGCAVKCPIVGIFYLQLLSWMPDTKIYKAKIVKENQSADNIISNLDELLSE